MTGQHKHKELHLFIKLIMALNHREAQSNLKSNATPISPVLKGLRMKPTIIYKSQLDSKTNR